MSGHPPQRRQAHVGSMVLTPQENECLFNCLGRKCIVSFSIKFCHGKLSENANAANILFPVARREASADVEFVCGL